MIRWIKPLLRPVIHLVLFFSICLGFGYAVLNRYDPRTIGNVDSRYYYSMVEKGSKETEGHWRFRILLPYLAKPLYHVLKGRVGSWDPAALALLLVAAGFCSFSAWLIGVLTREIFPGEAAGLLAGFLYLCNFTVVNGHLQGLVDAGEGFFLILLAWALYRQHWGLLPVIGVFATMAKYTFIPLGIALSVVWLAVNWRKTAARKQAVGMILGLGLAGFLSLWLVQGLIAGSPFRPTAGWQFWGYSISRYYQQFKECLSGETFFYVFFWLFPLSVYFLGQWLKPLFRRPWQGRGYLLATSWSISSLAAAFTALIMGGLTGSGGNCIRAIFNSIGPVLSVAATGLLLHLPHRLAEEDGSLDRTIGHD